jgi:hypothetical protein
MDHATIWLGGFRLCYSLVWRHGCPPSPPTQHMAPLLSYIYKKILMTSRKKPTGLSTTLLEWVRILSGCHRYFNTHFLKVGKDLDCRTGYLFAIPNQIHYSQGIFPQDLQ